jgi:hypothetical protein
VASILSARLVQPLSRPLDDVQIDCLHGLNAFTVETIIFREQTDFPRRQLRISRGQRRPSQSFLVRTDWAQWLPHLNRHKIFANTSHWGLLSHMQLLAVSHRERGLGLEKFHPISSQPAMIVSVIVSDRLIRLVESLDSSRLLSAACGHDPKQDSHIRGHFSASHMTPAIRGGSLASDPTRAVCNTLR